MVAANPCLDLTCSIGFVKIYIAIEIRGPSIYVVFRTNDKTDSFSGFYHIENSNVLGNVIRYIFNSKSRKKVEIIDLFG